MNLAVFILPKGPLNADLVRWKDRVKKENPNQPYTLHPPHMTLINIELLDEKDGINYISELITNIEPFHISIQSRDVFWNDHTTGGHTLFFRVEPSNSLFILQKLVAEALKPVRKRLPVPKNIKENKEFLDSFKKYSTPFIGRHWIPHFSVSSLRIRESDSLIKEFLSSTETYEFLIDQFSLWRIDKDEHIILKTLNFK